MIEVVASVPVLAGYEVVPFLPLSPVACTAEPMNTFPVLDSISSGSIMLAQNAPAPPFGGMGILPFIVLIGMVFYFMVLRPENVKRADQERMRNDLKKNDRIVTIGGIHGTVVNAPAEGDEVTIKLDENSPTRMRISRAAIQTVLTNKDNSN